MSRSILVAAGRYGFSGTLDEGGLTIKVWDTIIASTGPGASVRISIEGERVVLRAGGSFSRRIIELENPSPGLVVAGAYYLWLEQNRGLEARIVKEAVKAARRASPNRKCPEVLESVQGLTYSEGLCTRIAAQLAMGAYVLRSHLGISLLEDSLSPSMFELGGVLAEMAQAYASLVRALKPGYNNLEIVLRRGEEIYEKYGRLPGALKAGLVLASYTDRLPHPWHAYAAAITLVSKGFRLFKGCRGPGLSEPAILGEAEWIRSGDGSVRCEGGSPALLGISLSLYQRTGSVVSVVREAGRVSKCASCEEPLCSKSLVLDPGERALRAAASCAVSGECDAGIVYYRGKPIVACIRSGGEGVLSLYKLPGTLRLGDVVVAGRLASLVGGRPRKMLTGSALESWERARSLF